MKRSLILLFFLFLTRLGFAQIGFPYCEPFDGGSTNEATVFGGNARLVDGVLRLTENEQFQTGYIYVDIPFPSFYGIKAEFEYFSYGGDNDNRADGMVMFLFDAATQNFAPGGFGGSLGYAQRNTQNGVEPGLTNAYMGIGFDEFGNFGNFSEGKIGGFNGSGNNLVPNAVVVRGPGSGLNGYEFITGRRTADAGNLGLSEGFEISSGGTGTQRVTDPNQVGYRKVFIELEPKEQGVGYNFSVDMLVTTEPNSPRLVPIFERSYNFEPPRELKVGFAASTGGFTNFHEIRNLIVQVSADDQLQDPEGVDFEDIASCEGQENTYFITDEEVVLPNEDSRIRCLQFYESLEDIVEEGEDICNQAKCVAENRELVLPQGTFRAGDNSGDYTFFPNEGFTGEEVTVYYTITDNYGKTSAGNSMTLTIQESPEPISLFVEESTEIQEIKVICEGDEIELVSEGNEVYERYEWYKDDVLIEGAVASVLTVSEPGDYEVLAFNRKNCPTTSNLVSVQFPAYPSLIIQNPVVGCEAGQPINAFEYMAIVDLELYDYLVTGQGQSFENEEIQSIPLSGSYQIQGKPKEVDCYSEPEPFEVIIRDEELVADFDFVVQGTNIRGDEDGGIFPDDVIELTDLSEEAVEWLWEFGDGASSNDQNPIHVFGAKGNFEVTLSIRDQFGCITTVTKEVAITRSFRVMFPTGFTPLSDENQFFMPKFKGLERIDLYIFNTWGELIFNTSELESEGWDGRLEGELLDAGVYVYRFVGISTEGDEVEESGKFRLIR